MVADDLEVGHQTVVGIPPVEQEGGRLVASRPAGRSARSRWSAWAVLGQVIATVPAKRRRMKRWRWPLSTRSTWRCLATTSVSPVIASGARPIASMCSMPGGEGRMVESDDGGRGGRSAQHVVEPGQLLRVEGAAGLREAAAVEGDDAQRPLDHAVGATVAIVDQPRERGAEVVGAVVVARHEVQRCRQRLEQLGQVLVLGGRSVVHQVAAHEHQVRRRSASG